MTKLANERNGSRETEGLAMFHIHEYRGVPSGDHDDDRAEKPWQRVPSVVLILVLGVYLLLAFLTQLVEDDMPRVITEESLPRDNSDSFSEEAAWGYLHRILGDAPRVSGTKYHLQKTQDMKGLVDEIAARANIKVSTDWQMVTGDYFLENAAPFFNYYQNCSNILALLEGESGFHDNGTLGSSILVNCHYDSVPFAIGASDNGIFCAVMAETLTKLSRRRTKLKHNVLFLFNGAEENPLQASHAFLSHPWAQGVVSVVNLDSAGMNGKPIVFQVTDPRLIHAYRRSAYRPAAQGVGEFLFSSGIIPSDTDFRVFRDFGNIQGIDIAFSKMGNVYHTRNDRPELIKPGVMQSAGDMLIRFVADLADNEEMGHKIEPAAAVYYDYLNAFMLSYSFTAAYVVDVFIVLPALASVYYYLWIVGPRLSSVQELLFAALGRLASLLVGVAFAALCLVIMVASTTQMRYLSRPWLVIPLYWLPYLIAAIATSQVYDMWRYKRSGLSRSLRTHQAMASTRLIISVVTIILMCIPGLNALRYLFTIPLLLMTILSSISLTVIRYIRLTGWQHLLLEMLLSLPLMMWVTSLALRLDAMMLPIMGRSSGSSPDYIVGLLNIGLAALVAFTVAGMELLFSRKYLWMVLAAVGAACVVLMFIPFSPYDEEGIALQRHYWFHTQMTSYDINRTPISQTSGIMITRQDPYSLTEVTPALTSSGIHVNYRSGFGNDCDNLVYCGMPLYRTTFGAHYPNAMFLYTGPPAPFETPASLTVESKSCSANTCTYNFLMTGGAHNLMTFWPYGNVTASGWSLQSPVQESFRQLDRPVYIIFHSTPTYMDQWSFRFTIVFNVPQSLQSGPIVEVSHHSHKLHHPEDFTAEYRNILNSMPKFLNIATIISFRNNYIF